MSNLDFDYVATQVATYYQPLELVLLASRHIVNAPNDGIHQFITPTPTPLDTVLDGGSRISDEKLWDVSKPLNGFGADLARAVIVVLGFVGHCKTKTDVDFNKVVAMVEPRAESLLPEGHDAMIGTLLMSIYEFGRSFFSSDKKTMDLNPLAGFVALSHEWCKQNRVDLETVISHEARFL